MKTNEQQFDAWEGTMHTMTNAWKEAAEKWQKEQQETMQDINSLAKNWMGSYGAAIATDSNPLLKHMYQHTKNAYGFTDIMDSMWYKTFLTGRSALYTLYSASKTYLEPASDTMNNLYKHMQLSALPFSGMHKMPDPSSCIKLMEHYDRLLMNMMQMQFMLKEVMSSASKRMLEIMNERTEKGKPFEDFKDFYNEWSAINEEAYASLFRKEEYIKLQQESGQLRSEILVLYGKVMEWMPFPFALRPQSENNAEPDNELRERVEKLEKQMAS